jgi:hypothetical protein
MDNAVVSRQRIIGVVATVAAVGLAGCTGAAPASSAPHHGSAVERAALPTADHFSALTTVGSRLVLRGDADGPGCRSTSATVDPVTLTLGPVAVSSCAQPDLAGRRAAADLDYDPTTTSETFAVATRTNAGAVETGPVLATFEAPAGDHPATTTADGYIWVWGSPVAGGGSQVTQVSATTGAVIETVSLPHSDFGTPLLAADDDGLWLSLPPNTEDTAPTPVYFLAAGRHSVRVTHLPARAGWWMVAHGHQVWIDALGDAGPPEILWTAKGPGGGLERLGRLTLPTAGVAGDTAPVAAGGTTGLWTFERGATSCALTQPVRVVRVVADRPAVPVATVELPVSGCVAQLPGAGAVVDRDGFLYFLVDGSALYRVRV